MTVVHVHRCLLHNLIHLASCSAAVVSCQLSALSCLLHRNLIANCLKNLLLDKCSLNCIRSGVGCIHRQLMWQDPIGVDLHVWLPVSKVDNQWHNQRRDMVECPPSKKEKNCRLYVLRTLQHMGMRQKEVRTKGKNNVNRYHIYSLLGTVGTELQKASVSQCSRNHFHHAFITGFILPFERNPNAEKTLSTYACDAGAASRSWAMCKFMKECLLLLPKLNSNSSAKSAPAWLWSRWLIFRATWSSLKHKCVIKLVAAAILVLDLVHFQTQNFSYLVLVGKNYSCSFSWLLPIILVLILVLVHWNITGRHAFANISYQFYYYTCSKIHTPGIEATSLPCCSVFLLYKPATNNHHHSSIKTNKNFCLDRQTETVGYFLFTSYD